MSKIFVSALPKQPAAALQDDLEALVAAGTGPWDGAKVRLFKNDFEPNSGMVLGDLTQAAFTGYAESSAIVWGAPFIDDQKRAVVMGGSKQFTGGDAVDPETIYGYYVVNSAGTGLLLAERFDEPIVMDEAADAIVIVPAYVRGQAPAVAQ